MLLSLLIFMFMGCSNAEEISVRVNEGPVRGRLVYVGGNTVYAFKNIPFAKQPVGDLRLEMPREPEKWMTEQDLPGDIEIHCPQLLFSERQDLMNVPLGQEDCLVLDVYVRKEHESGKSSLPVLVYFHGGGFSYGSKEEYDPDFLLRHNDIILVVPNYRLGILGFLSFQDVVLPGNLALWDQNAALKWVFRNIDRFGGDPLRITIGGHEAGGTSVGLHILAPVSHDYFQGALSCSGTAFSPMLISSDPTPEVAYKVAGALQCRTSSKKDMLTCMKTTPLENILQAQKNLSVAFLPTVDSAAENPFMPYSPQYLYAKGYQKSVNYLLGFTEDEAAFEVSREFPKVLKFQHLDKMINHFLQPYFDNFSNLEMIVKASKYHYMKGMVIPSFESIEPKIAKIMTDFLYESPVHRVIKAHGKGTENVFMYVFNHRGYNFLDGYCGLGNGRCYGNEIYIFNKTNAGVPYELILKAKEVIEVLSSIWGNFVKFGVPNVEGKWKKFGISSERNYVEISDVVQPKVNHNREDTEFWTSLVSDLMAAKNSSQELLASASSSENSVVGTWGAAGLAILCGVVCIAIIGLVLITKRRTFTMSVVPVSSLNKDIRA